jgi:hypothetical protein
VAGSVSAVVQEYGQMWTVDLRHRNSHTATTVTITVDCTECVSDQYIAIGVMLCLNNMSMNSVVKPWHNRRLHWVPINMISLVQNCIM